jgi:hypothetical protein
MTTILGINDRVNETLGITAELEITSQDAEFFNQILSSLAYDGSCTVNTLNQTIFSCGGWLEFKLRYRPVWVGFL